MSTLDLHTSNDDYEDLFGFTLPELEADVDFDLPCVSPRVFESLLSSIHLQSPTSSSVSSVSSPAPFAGDSISVSQTATVVSMKAKRYRSRKREELETLRRAVKSLEVRLAVLKARPDQVPAPSQQQTRIWEAVASQESERRQRAEHENDELRKSVERHRQLAQKLDQVVHRVVAHVTKNSYS